MKNKSKKNTNAAPQLQGIKTQWDLSLLYSSAHDPKIEADLLAIEAAFDRFARLYDPAKGGDTSYLHNSDALGVALGEYESLHESLQISKPITYFHYRTTLDGNDTEALGWLNKNTERLSKAQNNLLFFTVSLGHISKDTQDRFLSHPSLRHYHFFLKNIFLQSRHNLSEAEEKIMNRMALTSYSLWVDGTEKILQKLTVPFGKKKLPLSQASTMVSHIENSSKRKELHQSLMKTLKSAAEASTNELNAIVSYKKASDELRGYEKPYSSTVLAYQNEEATVETLVNAVENSFQKVSQRFYTLKAKLLKLKKAGYQDRAVSIGTIKRKFSFEQAASILRKAFSELDPRFVKILDQYLAQGQIDAHARVGKRGGAFCSSNVNAPSFVLLNHDDSFYSVCVFGHEMGHAIHGELSQSTQRGLYRDYSISTAEVASTFFEGIVFDYVTKDLSDEERKIALHDKLNDQIQTVFRQIAVFKFEMAMHMRIREKGAISGKELAALMNEHMHSYLGPSFSLTEDDGYYFIGWPHIRYFFYVYSYAFGSLISSALLGRLKKDPTFISKVITFLSAGGSKSPEAIFKDIGIDITKPSFWLDGIAQIEAKIDELEAICLKPKKK
jgi:oligoendopeptidase F